MTSANEDLVRRLWHRIWIDGDLDKLSELVTESYTRHTRDGTLEASPSAYARQIESAVRTIKGTEVVVDHIASVDDMVFARLTLRAINIETGAKVTLRWLVQYRLEEGRIAESWTMHQSGLDW